MPMPRDAELGRMPKRQDSKGENVNLAMANLGIEAAEYI